MKVRVAVVPLIPGEELLQATIAGATVADADGVEEKPWTVLPGITFGGFTHG